MSVIFDLEKNVYEVYHKNQYADSRAARVEL